MTKDEAVRQIRSQVKQLAAAAATECLTMRRGKKGDEWAMVQFDRMADELAAPALAALEVLRGDEPQPKRRQKPTMKGQGATISPI